MYSVETGQPAVGMDLKEASLSYARREAKRYRLRVSYLKGSVLEPPFAPESFDSVYLGQVIEHIHEDRAVVREAFRLLRPQGKLLISVPRGQSCMTDPDADDGHVNFYESENDCRDLLTGLDLDDVQFHEGDNHRFLFSAVRGSKPLPSS